MKILKKGKKYTKVSPLPNGWIGAKCVARGAESKGKYAKAFQELKKLLDDGWRYCPKEEFPKRQGKGRT